MLNLTRSFYYEYFLSPNYHNTSQRSYMEPFLETWISVGALEGSVNKSIRACIKRLSEQYRKSGNSTTSLILRSNYQQDIPSQHHSHHAKLLKNSTQLRVS